MPKKKLQKSIQVYFSKFKKQTTHPQLPSKSFAYAATCRILPRCGNPRTPSFALDRGGDAAASAVCGAAAAAHPETDGYLFGNFLYQTETSEDYYDERSEGPAAAAAAAGGGLGESTQFIDISPNTSLTASEEPGSSSMSSNSDGSVITAVSEEELKDLPIPDDCTAVMTESANPYDDFRESMEKMVEAQLEQGLKVDWDFMEELLFCYLNLNDKTSYKYILSAFVDLVVVLRQNSGKVPARIQVVDV